MDFQQVKSRFDTYAENPLATNISPGIKGACIAVLEKNCGGEANRRLILKALTGQTSSRGLSLGQWYALLKLVDPHTSEVVKGWIGRDNLPEICGAIMTHVLEADGAQVKLFEAARIERMEG